MMISKKHMPKLRKISLLHNKHGRKVVVLLRMCAQTCAVQMGVSVNQQVWHCLKSLREFMGLEFIQNKVLNV